LLVGGEYHIGLREPISLRTAGARTSAEHALSFIGVPEDEVGEFKQTAGTLGEQLRFTNSQDQPDVAIFSTGAVAAFASAMRALASLNIRERGRPSRSRNPVVNSNSSGGQAAACRPYGIRSIPCRPSSRVAGRKPARRYQDRKQLPSHL
jgi:hypothetical protein